MPRTIVPGIIFLLLLSVLGCSSGDPIPEEVRQLMIDEAISTYEVFAGNFAPEVIEFNLEIEGPGKPLPQQTNSGVEQLVCYRVRIQTGENQYNLPWSNQQFTFQGFATRVGNHWETDTLYLKSVWDKHSCPGECVECDGIPGIDL